MPASTVFFRSPTTAAAVNASLVIEGNALFTAVATSVRRQPSMIRRTICSPGAFSKSLAMLRGVSAGETV